MEFPNMTTNTPPEGHPFKCLIRKGYRSGNQRGGTVIRFKSKASEELGVAKAKIVSFMHRMMSTALLVSDDVYFIKLKVLLKVNT